MSNSTKYGDVNQTVRILGSRAILLLSSLYKFIYYHLKENRVNKMCTASE